MRVKDILFDDCVNYKKIGMFVETSTCCFKCGKDICQNSELAHAPIRDIPDEWIIKMYKANTLQSAIIFGGLEPFEQWDELKNLIEAFRMDDKCKDDDIVIYTGYYEEEIPDEVNWLREHAVPCVVKFGRYVPGIPSVYSEELGVTLASANQNAVRLAKITIV